MVDSRVQVRSAHSRRHRSRWLTEAVFYAMLLGLLVPIMFPYYWMLIVSLKTHLEATIFPISLVFVPKLDSYVRVFTQTDMPQVLLNSLIVGVASTGLGLVLSLPAAFAIARFKFRGFSTVVLVARMLPGIAMLLPWYIMFVRIRQLGTYWALIFSHLSVSVPLIIWVSIGFFEDLPQELMDAAAIDGCSLLGAFWRVALPLVRPGVAAAAVLAFINSWNNFLYSLVLGGKIQMAPVSAYNMIKVYGVDWGALNASAVIISWPVILLSLPFGKNLIRGLTSGAVK